MDSPATPLNYDSIADNVQGQMNRFFPFVAVPPIEPTPQVEPVIAPMHHPSQVLNDLMSINVLEAVSAQQGLFHSFDPSGFHYAQMGNFQIENAQPVQPLMDWVAGSSNLHQLQGEPFQPENLPVRNATMQNFVAMNGRQFQLTSSQNAQITSEKVVYSPPMEKPSARKQQKVRKRPGRPKKEKAPKEKKEKAVKKRSSKAASSQPKSSMIPSTSSSSAVPARQPLPQEDEAAQHHNRYEDRLPRSAFHPYRRPLVHTSENAPTTSNLPPASSDFSTSQSSAQPMPQHPRVSNQSPILIVIKPGFDFSQLTEVEQMAFNMLIRRLESFRSVPTTFLHLQLLSTGFAITQNDEKPVFFHQNFFGQCHCCFEDNMSALLFDTALNIFERSIDKIFERTKVISQVRISLLDDGVFEGDFLKCLEKFKSVQCELIKIRALTENQSHRAQVHMDLLSSYHQAEKKTTSHEEEVEPTGSSVPTQQVPPSSTEEQKMASSTSQPLCEQSPHALFPSTSSDQVTASRLQLPVNPSQPSSDEPTESSASQDSIAAPQSPFLNPRPELQPSTSAQSQFHQASSQTSSEKPLESPKTQESATVVQNPSLDSRPELQPSCSTPVQLQPDVDPELAAFVAKPFCPSVQFTSKICSLTFRTAANGISITIDSNPAIYCLRTSEGNTDVYFGEKLQLKDTSNEVFQKILESLMANQQKTMGRLKIYFDEKEDFVSELFDCLEKLNLFRVKIIILGVHNELQARAFLSRAEPGILRKIKIVHSKPPKEAPTLDLEKFGALPQWRRARKLKIRDFVLVGRSWKQQVIEFEKAEIKVEKICGKDFVPFFNYKYEASNHLSSRIFSIDYEKVEDLEAAGNQWVQENKTDTRSLTHFESTKTLIFDLKRHLPGS